MYNNNYGPEFLAKPDKVEIIQHDGEDYDLEIRTHRLEHDAQTDIIILFRLCDQQMKRPPYAVGTYYGAGGRVHHHEYDDDYSFAQEGFHDIFIQKAEQISKNTGCH